ncbi:hypothetical protein MMC13_001012 [Lambiella insularis]|nr:hypothetical protein [Lambiella insularis]
MSHQPLFPPHTPLTSTDIAMALSILLTHQETAVTIHAKRPFAALLLGPDCHTVLLTHLSIDHVNHAESCLARLAATHYSQSYLWTCTLVSTWEPCAMCAGTIYWANIGRVVYGAGEDRLREITGEGNEENFTMRMGCREVFASGQKEVQVIGPVEDWEERVVASSDVYWKPVRDRVGREITAGADGGFDFNSPEDVSRASSSREERTSAMCER